ncbi:RNA polymerase subunit sigma [Clostridium folliculivorans]|uniref:RNA polymerase sigma factor n=1 Tax=Clostridium folliculivorans TaxID=2886038 RepID=A0A9W5Y4H7_9CLOT|nr:RNA polymerase subunit sigma [Clostridium folliculivorans]GKU26375.1 RNA polymerase sigma factor [Clostridium folliculivorans]GKU32070.1 RNA polymerase sigma factor [Clostridium folliculivorans]
MGTSDKFKKIEAMLYNYKQTEVEIKNIDLDIEEVRNEYRGVGAMVYGERTSSTNKISSSVENEIEYKENRISYLTSLKRSKEIELERLNNVLSILSEDEYKLIELRYFKKLQYKQIADIICMNDIYIIDKKKKIINKLIPLMNI